MAIAALVSAVRRSLSSRLSALRKKLQVLNLVIHLFEILPQYHLALLFGLRIHLLIMLEKML